MDTNNKNIRGPQNRPRSITGFRYIIRGILLGSAFVSLYLLLSEAFISINSKFDISPFIGKGPHFWPFYCIMMILALIIGIALGMYPPPHKIILGESVNKKSICLKSSRIPSELLGRIYSSKSYIVYVPSQGIPYREKEIIISKSEMLSCLQTKSWWGTAVAINTEGKTFRFYLLFSTDFCI